MEKVLSLARLNRLVSSSLDTEHVLTTVASTAADLVKAPFAHVWILDEQAGELQIGASSPGPAADDFGRARYSLDRGAVGWIARHRAPLALPDVFADDRFLARDWARRHGFTSFHGLPILLDDRLLGVLGLLDGQPFRLTEDDRQLLDVFAGQAAAALNNARLYREAQDSSDRLRAVADQTRALLEVAAILGSTLDTIPLLKRVTTKIAEVTGVDRCSIERWDGDRVIPLMSQFADGRHDPAMWQAFRGRSPYVPRDVPVHARAIETRRPVVVDDTRTTADIPRDWIDAYGLKSVMVVPLIRQDTVIGVMTLDHCTRARRFSASQVELATAVAGQLALSIENARLYDEVRERLREATTLLAVGEVISAEMSEAESIRRVCREIGRAFGADMVGAYFTDESGATMRPLAGYHVPPELREHFLGRPMRLERFPLLLEAWRHGRAAWSGDPLNDPRFDPEWLRGLPSHSVILAPAIAGGVATGALFLVWWQPGRPFARAEIRLIEAVGRQVGLALANAHLSRQTAAKVTELSVLHELSRAVTGQLDRIAVLDAVHRHVARVLDGNQMVVVLETGDGGFARVFEVRHGERVAAPGAGAPADLVSVVVRTGHALCTDDYTAACAEHGVRPEPGTFRYWLGVPMRAGGHVMGALALQSPERPFTTEDERLLSNIADLGALALRSAHLFEERTRAYQDLAAAQDQLVRTEKLRALGEMASGIAHDFNNLLAAIVGRAQLLLNRVTDPKLQQWLGVIERAALDGAQTVRRLQEFTRVRRDAPLVAVDLNQIVRDALDITQPRWRDEPASRGVGLHVVTRLRDIPQIAGDAAELREALTNLILNAVDAMPSGGTLTLDSSALVGGVRLIVSDTGHGMPEGVRARIFDPFFTTKGSRGTGLGLAMTYGILSRHGATVEVESAEGRGTTFRLVFPHAERVLHDGAVPPPATAPPPTPLTCLVVDDDEAVGSVVADMIGASGHSAVAVFDPAVAVERLQREHFDVVFTDLAMPGLSGWEVTRAVKGSRPDVPVFLMTGFGVELSEDERRRHGLEAVLVKPLKIDTIADALRRAADRTAMRHPAGDPPWPTST